MVGRAGLAWGMGTADGLKSALVFSIVTFSSGGGVVDPDCAYEIGAKRTARNGTRPVTLLFIGRLDAFCRRALNLDFSSSVAEIASDKKTRETPTKYTLRVHK